VEWKHVIFIMNLLCVGGSEIHIYILVLFDVLAAYCTYGLRNVCFGWQRVICIIFVLCGGVASCHKFDVCIGWFCVRVLQVLCVYCVVGWQSFYVGFV